MLMRITPITGTIGAELSGLDLKQPISEDLEQALRPPLIRTWCWSSRISFLMQLNTVCYLKSSANRWSIPTLQVKPPIRR